MWLPAQPGCLLEGHTSDPLSPPHFLIFFETSHFSCCSQLPP